MARVVTLAQCGVAASHIGRRSMSDGMCDCPHASARGHGGEGHCSRARGRVGCSPGHPPRCRGAACRPPPRPDPRRRRSTRSAPTSARTSVQFLFAQFVDMHGKPSAKLVPASHLDDLLADGAGFAGYAAGPVGQRPNDPDLIAMPDPASFTPLPWKPEVARLACDLYVDGEPWPYCPRTILRRQLAKATELGYELKIGAELEYFLLRRAEDGTLEVADELDTMEQPCYDMRALTRNLDFVGEHLAVPQRARLGQLRHRPRGRQRPVRAELRLRGRAARPATARCSSATWSRRSRRSAGSSRRSCPSRSRT